MKYYSLVLYLISLTAFITAHAEPLHSQVHRFIYPCVDEIRIDGILDEGCYKTSLPFDGFVVAGAPGKDCQSTRCWVSWDSRNLYFAFECEDSWIHAPDAITDESEIGSHDRVEVFLWSGNENDSYMSLEIGAQGLAYDYATRFYRHYDRSFALRNSEYKVLRKGKGYCAEMRISAEDLRQFGIVIGEGNKIRAGLYRADYFPEKKRDPVWITWVDANGPSPDFHIPDSFGEFTLAIKKEVLPVSAVFDRWRIGEENMLLQCGNPSESRTLEIGKWADGVVCEWIGTIDGGRYALLNTTSRFLLLREEDMFRVFNKPESRKFSSDGVSRYGGMTKEEMLAEGRDILGEKILEKPEFNPDEIGELLPPIREGYQLLGSPLSGPPLRMMKSGAIYGGMKEDTTVFFDPAVLEPRLKGVLPVCGLIDDWMPVAHYTYRASNTIFELNAFIAYWDRGISPITWIRLAEVAANGAPVNTRYWSATPRPVEAVSFGRGVLKEENARTFWKEFAYTLHKWEGLGRTYAMPEIPDRKILKNIQGSIALTHVVFSGFRPRYGAVEYGRTCHETFPPTFISVLETAFAYGEKERTERLMDLWLTNFIKDDGTFSYFMGRLMPAASASEYGMIFTLLERIDRAYDGKWGIQCHLDKLLAAARYLISLRQPVEGMDVRLIYLGAEADNEKLKYAYFSNNLWVVQGMKSLSRLFQRYGRTGTAQFILDVSVDLEKDVQKALEQCAEDSQYGLLPPIHTDYAALPLTLSAGMKKPAGIDDETWTDYNAGKDVAVLSGAARGKHQNLRENTYANYRYYLEMLSSGLLPSHMADAIADLREERGGMLLGMTRFLAHLDDWPVAEWASFLLSRDMLDKYWLLLYAHKYHHMDRSLLTAYEQVGIDGSIRADACLPAQLVIPRMLAWAFAWESPGSDTVCLLRGIPPEWYTPGKKFSWKKLTTPAGILDIGVVSKDKEIEITLRFESEFSAVPLALFVNCVEEIKLAAGREYVDGIQGRKMILKSPYTGAIRLVLER